MAHEERYVYADEAIAELTLALNTQLAEEIKALLETRHLYHRVALDPTKLVAAMARRVYGDDDTKFARLAEMLLEYTPVSATTQQMYAVAKGSEPMPSLELILRNIKLSCSVCDGRETFTPLWWTEVANAMKRPVVREMPNFTPTKVVFQLFLLVYKCQSCDSHPTSFLVRRDRWKFSLDGRSPIEHVTVPTYIPRPERELFADALVATRGGKTLAALFYLRAVIEQFTRRETRTTARVPGDQLMDAYAATLPLQHRDHMPSLREWYDRLSEAIHAARNDADLFDQARKAIEQHFDIRRVFRIPESGTGSPS